MSDNPRLRRKSKSKEQQGGDNQGNRPNGTFKQSQQNGYKHNTPKQSKPINNHQNGQQGPELKSSQPVQNTELVEFNIPQIEQYLQNLWDVTCDQSKDSTLSSTERPTVYQDSSKAWGSEAKNTVLNNFNFLHELKLAYVAKFGNSSLPKSEHPLPLDETSNNNSGNKNNTNNNDTSNVNNNSGRNVNNNINNDKANNKTESNNNKNNTHAKKDSADYRNEAKGMNGKHEKDTPKGVAPKETKEKGVKETKETKQKVSKTADVKTTEAPKEQAKEIEQEKEREKESNNRKDDEQKSGGSEKITRVQKYEGPQTAEETQHLLQEENEENEEDEEEEDGEEKKDKIYDYGFTTDEYEEIADPHPADGESTLPKMPNGKNSNGKGKSKKAKKGKGGAKKDDSKQGNKNNNNNTNNINNNNYNGNNNNLNNNGSKEALNDLFGNILSRTRPDSVKSSGTGTLQLDNSGNFHFLQETLHSSSSSISPSSSSSSLTLSSPPSPPPLSSLPLFQGVPREVVRVFANRFSKPNPSSTSSEFPGVMPVKWNSGEGLMAAAAGRKFPIEMPFFLKDMLGNPSSSSSSSFRPSAKTSCANLKCTNTTTEDKPFKTCAKCNVTAYCCRECQVEDWMKRHKQACKTNVAAAEEQRKNVASQKFWSTSSVRQMMYLHWHGRYGKGLIVMMSKDFLASADDDTQRETYMFYLSMADLASEDIPIPSLSLKKIQSEFSKAFSHHESDTYVIPTVAVDSTGFVATHTDEVKSIQLKLHKRSYKEHDLQKVDAISIDSHNQAFLFTFH